MASFTAARAGSSCSTNTTPSVQMKWAPSFSHAKARIGSQAAACASVSVLGAGAR